MSEHTAAVTWTREGAAFSDGRYSRGHVWQFDGGVSVPASAAAENAPPGCAIKAAVDPEEAFVAALSSCHMLFFLFYAARKGLVVEQYSDAATGLLAKNDSGVKMMTRVTLRPQVTYRGRLPERAVEEDLHHRAHASCFIANSVITAVETEIRPSAVV